MMGSPLYYRICSCGKVLCTRGKRAIGKHREKGHIVPLRHYKAEELPLGVRIPKLGGFRKI
jgi:hypothetical protein